ncbi:hypothetical protein O181_028629 [Austropuccinia psidii MF-1]|uniref:Uncharacterized protein n=1 Tax=Austropuccinia psidii MF-1 TaxID=1389203 RepID=A0A9Q3CR10_9BASI|nr:hypothetical protein [Austropuccinia psidii MF-1]
MINPDLTSKGKLPKVVDNKFVEGTVKGTSQRTEKAFPEPQELEEDSLETVVDGKKLREIIHTPPFTFQLNRKLKPEDWKDMDQVLQLHQLQKHLFQWSMENKSFNLASNLAELEASYQKICSKEMLFGNFQRMGSHQAVQNPGGEGSHDKGETSHYPSYKRTAEPDRAYSDSIRLTWSRPTQLSSGFKPFRHQQIGGQELPLFTIPGGFQENASIKGQKQGIFQPKEERVRTNDPEAV